MTRLITWAKTAMVAMVNVFLLCGAGYVFDWAGHKLRCLLHAYRQQPDESKNGVLAGMTKLFQTWK